MITYSLDENNFVIDVGGEWDAFARANQGENLTREHVIGKSLFDFINGLEIKTIYASLFDRVRSQKKVLSFTFRCDGPFNCRLMSLTIRPRPDQAVCVQTDVLEDTEREEIPLYVVGTPRTSETIAVCCICGNVKSMGDVWVPIEEESVRRNFPGQAALPQLSHGFCPNCFADQLQLVAKGV